MTKIYNKKQIYNALDIDINLRNGGSMNPRSMTGLIDNIIVNGNNYGSGGGRYLYVVGTRDENDVFTPNEGEPTWDEAFDVYTSGGNVLCAYQASQGGEYSIESIISYIAEGYDTPFLASYENIAWPKPDDDPGPK